MFGLIPKEEAFFDLFKKAAHNMIEGSRLLKDMMEDFRDPAGKAKRIKEVEHVGDGITHDIATRLNQTFITPIDREDIHDLASALDDILDAVEAVADRFVIYKIANRPMRRFDSPISCTRRPWRSDAGWTASISRTPRSTNAASR